VARLVTVLRLDGVEVLMVLMDWRGDNGGRRLYNNEGGARIAAG
jgi:hypothetical protein